MFKSTWTKEQDQYLAENRQKMKSADLAASINEKFGTAYSKMAVIGRATRLGIPLDKKALRISTGVSWTPEQDELLRSKHSEIPLKELVELINWTFGTKYSLHSIKNSVKRLGLTGSRWRKAPADKKAKAPPKQGSTARTEEVFKPRVVATKSHRKTILDLKAMECRWPDDEPHPETGWWTFCGCRTADGSSYCPAHAELSKGQGTASERNALGLLRREAA
jgi:hypothetical protein